MVAIVDYGVGNLFSLRSSLAALDQEVCVTNDPKILKDAGKIILPGVGAFEDAAKKLYQTGLVELLFEQVKKGVPMMGICLGMQLLFEKSFEYGEHKGLGLIPGHVRPISEVITPGLKIPHMGWNALNFPDPENRHPLFRDLSEGDHVYFVHSYSAVQCDPYVIATAEYGAPLTAAAAKDNVMGCQFHPEKSGKIGLKILKTFCEMK